MKNKILKVTFTIVIIVTVLVPLFLGNQLGWKPNIPEFSIQYIGVVISSISIIIVAITLAIQYSEISLQRKQLEELNHSNNKNFKISENSYDSNVLNLIENLFLSKEMEEVREKCFHLREKIKRDDEVFLKIKEIYKMQISDNWNLNPISAKIKKDELFNYYLAFERLARYFDTISNYELSNVTSSAIHFYYVWWRGLIKQMQNCFLEANEECDTKYLSFLPNWVTMPDRLDKQLLKFNLPLS